MYESLMMFFTAYSVSFSNASMAWCPQLPATHSVHIGVCVNTVVASVSADGFFQHIAGMIFPLQLPEILIMRHAVAIVQLPKLSCPLFCLFLAVRHGQQELSTTRATNPLTNAF